MTTDDLNWHRQNNAKLIALNMAYGVLMKHCPCLAHDVPLNGLAESIADAIIKGAITEDNAAR